MLTACSGVTVKLGVVMSRPWLIADEGTQEKLVSELSTEAIAFEMESAGVAQQLVMVKLW